MIKNKLTLLITLYKPKDHEIKYWFNFYKTNRNKIQIQFLVDGTKIDFDDSIDKEDIFENEENKGRFKMVYDHVKNKNVNTPYFKIVDPDDYISFGKLEKIVLPETPSIVSFQRVHSLESVETIVKNSSDKTIDLLLEYGKHIEVKSYGTPCTILPTEAIVNDNIYSGRKIYMIDDQFFGLLCYWNGYKLKLIKDYFYLYVPSIGELSNNDYFYKNISQVLNEINEILKANLKLGYPDINFPSILKNKLSHKVSIDDFLEKWDTKYILKRIEERRKISLVKNEKYFNNEY